MKILLYAFTGYMTLTGVISGTVDASAAKAAKIAISSAVPVIGGLLSDASEAVLVSAGVLRNTAGVYGMLTVLALLCRPFIQIGAQYLLLKGTDAICAGIQRKENSRIVGDFSTAMGMILAVVSTQSVLLLISTICFMKGAG